MNNIEKELLNEALELLGEVLAQRGHTSENFVVCGGSSLMAMDLVSRTATRDVDILARLEPQGLVQAKPLPDYIVEAANDVRLELDLPSGWLNTGPADDSFFRLGFPEGIEERLTAHSYGEALTLYYISRYDQIFFKLYAATDQGPGKHYADLKELKPKRDELLAAARWTRRQDPSDGFKLMLAGLLKELGYGDLTDQI